MKTYYVTLSRYQRVTVEVDARSRASAEEEALRQCDEGEIDEFDWITRSADVYNCEVKKD